MNININSDNKLLLAKCKLLGDYSKICEGTEYVYKKYNSCDSVFIVSKHLEYELDRNLRVISCRIPYLDEDSIIILDREEFKINIEKDISIGVTKEFYILGFRVLINNMLHLALVLDNSKLLAGYGSSRTIVGVREENGGILIETARVGYYIDIDSFECTELVRGM